MQFSLLFLLYYIILFISIWSLSGALDDQEIGGVKEREGEGEAALVSFSSMDEVGLRKKTSASTSGGKEDKG